MSIFGKIYNSLKNVYYERNFIGENTYIQNTIDANWDNLEDTLKISRTNPVALACFIYRSRVFASGEFNVVNKKNEVIEGHWLSELIKKPNPYHTKENFLEQYMWFLMAFGWEFIYPRKREGFNPDALYNLNSSLISFKEDIKTPFLFDNEDVNVVFSYDKEGMDLNLNAGDMIRYYDMPNGLYNDNMLITGSRLKALKQPLETIMLAYNAKNIAIKSNGKELYTVKPNSSYPAPFGEKEKQEIQRNLNSNYGLNFGRSRALITGTPLEHKSLHIMLSDLGLDESIISDAEKVVIGLGIPIDVIKYDPKKSTFENQKQSEIKFIQNTIQNDANNFASGLTTKFLKDTDLRLVASYDHLPIMHEENLKKFDVITKKATAAKSLIDLGISISESLSAVELDLKINDNTNETGE